jgi:hypothetical protein
MLRRDISQEANVNPVSSLVEDDASEMEISPNLNNAEAEGEQEQVEDIESEEEDVDEEDDDQDQSGSSNGDGEDDDDDEEDYDQEEDGMDEFAMNPDGELFDLNARRRAAVVQSTHHDITQE